MSFHDTLSTSHLFALYIKKVTIYQICIYVKLDIDNTMAIRNNKCNIKTQLIYIKNASQKLVFKIT